MIDPPAREALQARSPHNVVAIDLPQGDDPYATAAETLRAWMDKGAVVRDPEPAIWALAQERGIQVETPLGETMPGLVTTWLLDPDQVTNYFAEIRPRQRPAQTAATPAR